MSTSKPASAAIEEMHACNSSSELLPKRVRNRNSSCATELSVLTNELLAKDLYASNARLKIQFYFLLFVNIALMATVGGLVYAHFLSKVDSSDQTPSKGIIQTKEGESSPKGGETEKLYRAEVSPGFDGGINCATLRYKLGAEVSKSRVACTFNDLIDALIKYVRPREYSEVIHLVGGKPENERNEHYEYTISDWRRDNDTNSSVKYHMTNSSIRIPSDGFYFLYCRLSFSSDNGESKRSSRTTIKHSIRIKPINQRFQKFVTVTTPMTDMIDSSGNSYIQRVAKFRKGEELKVTVSRAGRLQYDASDVTGNYFGMFKL